MSFLQGSPSERSPVDSDPYLSVVTPTASSSAVPRSPYVAATPPLSQRLRHTRLFSPPSPASSGAAAGTPAAATTAATSGVGASPISRAGTSIEAVAPRTVLKGDLRQHTPSWQPTRLTSPYCVLSAAGLQEDFYTSCLSWGTNQMALGLQDHLVLFHPNHPRQSPSRTRVSAPPPSGADVYASTAFSAPRRVTAVSMARFQEISCFVGMSNGAVELYEGSGDGKLHCRVAFNMPEPPTEYLSSLVSGAASGRAGRALDLLSSSISSIPCIGTSGRHPWLAAAATSARGLLTLDARVPQPALWFGSDGLASAAASTAAASALPSPLSTASSGVAAGDGGGLRRLQRASAFLRQHDRLCSVSWNATGSLVATGSGSGVVKVWSLSAPQRPVHSFLVDGDCSVKALAFHPERPYELLVGASAGPVGLRSYDLSSADPLLLACGATAAAVTQAVYDPEGHFAVTTAGTPTPQPATPGVGGRSPPRQPSTMSRVDGGSPGGFGGGSSSVLDRSPRWPHPTSPSHSTGGGGGGGSSSSRGPASAVALLQDAWADADDADDALADASPYLGGGDSLCDDYWIRSPVTTSEGGAASAVVTAHQNPPNALVVWRCGTRRREKYLRDALFRRPGETEGGTTTARSGGGGRREEEEEEEHEEGRRRGGVAQGPLLDMTLEFEDDDDGGGERRRAYASSSSASSSVAVGGDWRSGPSRRNDVASTTGSVPVSEWIPTSSLPGHRARPLLICAPFPQSPFAGCYASIAGGEDGTIRFWRIFEAASDATHWQHRRQAQQRSATTREDMDLFNTPVLR